MKFIILFMLFVFNLNQSKSQNVNTFHLEELGRYGNRSEFIYYNKLIRYLIIFERNTKHDFINVYSKNKRHRILRMKITALDTLELKSIIYKGQNAILIETSANKLVRHVLIISKKKVVLIENVKI